MLSKKSVSNSKRYAIVCIVIVSVCVGLVVVFAQDEPEFTAALAGAPYPGQGSRELYSLLGASPWDVPARKEALFAGRKRKTVRKVSLTATNLAQHRLYMTMYDTKAKVDNNYTDASLGWLAESPRLVKRRGAKGANAASGLELNNLTNFPPGMMEGIIDTMVAPWFVRGPLPAGAPDTTWASWSLWEAYKDIGKVTLIKRSAFLRMLADEQVIHVPTNTVLYFTWSGASDVSIDLSFKHWSKGDVAKLKKLLGHPLYDSMARRRIDLIQPPTPPPVQE